MERAARNTWATLGTVAPRSLETTRLELHRAAQILADVGRTYGPAKPDDSHTNLTFLPARRVLAGQFTPGTRRARAMLAFAPFRIVIEAAAGSRPQFLGSLPLRDVRAGDAWSWLEATLRDHLGTKHFRPLGRFSFPLAAGPDAGTFPFKGNSEVHFRELGAWYSNADGLLKSMRRKLHGASPVRCWPHHFDIAFLLPVSRGRGRTRGSIGIGLSPGDKSYREPYWYVTPSPQAPKPVLPALLQGGHWHRKGWTGAVLTGSRVIAAGNAAQQQRASREFLQNAVLACRNVILLADTEA